MKRKIIIAISVVVLLIIGSAVVFAQEALNDDQQEWFDSRAERVEALVNEGIITQEQADEYLEQLEQCISEGTCRGYGAGCTEGENCGFGVGRDGKCQGIAAGVRSGACRQFSTDETVNNYGNSCTGIGSGRGCGR